MELDALLQVGASLREDGRDVTGELVRRLDGTDILGYMLDIAVNRSR